jgi:mannosyl-3-phosphoglycerate phosphatase
MQRPENPIIFTDLDGTLLNHSDYSFSDAAEMLQYIRQQSIPLIIVSSKTKDEIETLQRDLGISEAFVVENGAGVVIPEASRLNLGGEQNEIIDLGKSYEEAVAFLEPFKARYGISGYSDMTNEDVVRLTGLKAEQAELSMRRGYTEPFIIEQPEGICELTEKANETGLDIVQGGRFYHVITQGQDKANALNYLSDRYQKVIGGDVTTIALGDSENDFTMLGAADIPVLIPKPDGHYAPYGKENVNKAPYPGPRGWNAMLKELFGL